MWIVLGIFLSVLARPEDVVRLHPQRGLVPESGKVSRPFLKLICKEKIKGGSREFAGYPVCTAPPPFVGDSAPPGQFGIRKIYLGHFTNPLADEAILATSGGEPHAANFGGTVLLERKNGAWEYKWYRSGLITKDCAKLKRRDRSELLVCFFGDIQNGLSIQDLYTVDLTKPPESEGETVLGLTDDTLNCGGYLNPRDEANVQRAGFKEIALSGDGTLLTAKVDFGVRRYSAAERGRCAIRVTNDLRLPAALLPETQPYEIRFNWDGGQFRVQPESGKSKLIVGRKSENR